MWLFLGSVSVMDQVGVVGSRGCISNGPSGCGWFKGLYQ